MKHPTGQPLAILLEPLLLEDNQASTEGATEVISLVVLVKEVASSLEAPGRWNHVFVVRSGLQHDLATSWPQYCQVMREVMLNKLLSSTGGYVGKVYGVGVQLVVIGNQFR